MEEDSKQRSCLEQTISFYTPYHLQSSVWKYSEFYPDSKVTIKDKQKVVQRHRRAERRVHKILKGVCVVVAFFWTYSIELSEIRSNLIFQKKKVTALIYMHGYYCAFYGDTDIYIHNIWQTRLSRATHIYLIHTAGQ